MREVRARRPLYKDQHNLGCAQTQWGSSSWNEWSYL